MGVRKSKQKVSTSTMNNVSNLTSSPSTIKPTPYRVQNYLVIWVDGNIDQASQDCQNTMAELRSIVKEVNVCTTSAQCIEILDDLDDEKAFVISSGALGQRLVPDIHRMPQLDTIYIFCSNKAWHEQWAKQWPKIQGIFTSITPICDSLKLVSRQCDHETIPISFLSKNIMAIEAASNETSFDQFEPSFMYSKLLKEILLTIDEDDAKSLEDLVAYCRNKNIPESELKSFQSQYYQKSPIWWYTCEIFLSSMLNCALRSLDIEAMINMGFFIRDLHRQLEQLCKEQSSVFKKQFIVYRGQGLTQQNFKQLLETKDGFISFNNFMSTSTEKHVALEFVENIQRKYEHNVGVLFIMRVDPSRVSASTTPFALIDDYSAISNAKEILFSMHTVFHIDEIKQTVNNSRLWEVELTLTDDNNSQLVAVIQRISEKFSESTGWQQLGALMLQMGHFNQAEDFFNEFLKKTSSDSDRADIYHMFGMIKYRQGQYKEAVSFCEKSLEMKRKSSSEKHPSLANNYSSIGLEYSNMGDYPKALEFYEKAKEIYEKTLPPNDLNLASFYNNIGLVYNNMGDYPKALEFYEKAKEIYEKTWPSNDLDLASSYNNIGQMYNNMGDYSKALEFCEKVKKIYETTLPPNDLDLASSYNNMGVMYNSMGDYLKALMFHEKALRIRQISLSADHLDLAVSYSNIAQVYYNMRDYSKALEIYKKDLEIKKKILSPNHPSLAVSYNNIGLVYNSISDYSKALEFYDKAHKIKEATLPPNHPSLAISYGNIGGMYCAMGDYAKALEFGEKALAIQQKSLPSTHSAIKRTINNINYVKKKM